MTPQVDLATLRLFNALVVTDKTPQDYPNRDDLMKQALQLGVIVDPSIKLTQERVDLIEEVYGGMDAKQMNTAFHKSWDKIRDTPEEILMVEQIIHYFSTYGLEAFGMYNESTIYIPNEVLEIPSESFPFTKISGITPAQLYKEFIRLSSIALSQSTIEDLFVVFTKMSYSRNLIDQILNRELRIRLYAHFGTAPSNPEEFVRYAVFVLTGETLVIKNAYLIEKIKKADPSLITKLIRNAPKDLASIFHRYKPIFLAMKRASHKHDKWFFNHLRKLADVLHKPYQMPYLQTVTQQIKDGTLNISELEYQLRTAKIEHIIRLINALRYRANNPSANSYKIRNGKKWVESYSFNPASKELLDQAIACIENAIRAKIGKNLSGTFYIPEGIDYALPTSERQFMGNIPIGTIIDIKANDVLIGVHWYDGDWRTDLDFSAISLGSKIGYSGRIRTSSGNVLWSGDMTAAPMPNGASEVIYFKNVSGIQDTTLLKLNYFNRHSDERCDYTLFVAVEKPNDFRKNYLVNPANVIMRIPMTIQKEQVIGTVQVVNKHLRLMLDAGSSSNHLSVSRYDEKGQREIEYQEVKSVSDLRLKDLIEICGGSIISQHSESDEYISLSPEALSKTTLLGLLKE